MQISGVRFPVLALLLAGATSAIATDVVRIVPDVPETLDRTVPFQGTVTAWDANSQPVPGYTGTVHFTGTTGVVLPTDYTFTPADNGVHTFTFTAMNGGHHAITATDVSNPTLGSSDTFHVNCPELTATAGNNGPVCAEGHPILYGSSNQSGVSYSWSGPFGWFSYQQNPTAPLPGTYFLEVTNSNGCTASATTTVGKITPPSIAVSQPASACGPETVTASVTNAASFTNFQWDVTGGTILSGQSTPSIQWKLSNTDGTLLAEVHATHTATGCNASGYSGVNVDPAFPADITVQSSSCAGATVTATVPQNFNAAYGWNVTNATVISDSLNTLVFKPTGAGNVTITSHVWNNWATCESTDTEVVTLTGPTATVDADLGICAGQSAVIPVTLGGTAPFRITWSDGYTQEGINSTSASRTVSPDETTIYTITSVSDSLCSGNANGSATVTVQTDPEIVTQPENAHIERGERATLSVDAIGADLLYYWYEGNTGDRTHFITSGPSATLTTPPLQSTTRYWVVVASGCGYSESQAATVSVGAGRRRSVRR